MKKYKKVNVEVILCLMLSLLGGINVIVAIWMAVKTKNKIQFAGGILSGAALIAGSIKWGGLGHISGASYFLLVLGIFLPIILIAVYAQEFVRRRNIQMAYQEFNIASVVASKVHCENIITPQREKKIVASSEALYEGDGLYIINLIWQSQQKIEQEKLLRIEREKKEKEEQERLKREERQNAKKEQEMAKKKKEQEKKELEAAKMQHEQEMLRLEQEKKKIEAEKVMAETEKLKAETEKLKYEAKTAKIDIINNSNKVVDVKKDEELLKKNSSQIHQLDINTCTEQELSLVPGIGIILAKKAIAIRQERNKYQSVDEFISLVGIREYNISNIKQYLICKESDNEEVNKVRKGRKVDL